jgi:predicted TIM-barrel fold metal-dependent hydrolase
MTLNKPILNIYHDVPTFPVPPGAVDCHTHVFGPSAVFPFDPKRTYTPADASIDDLLSLHNGLGIDKVVIVHPSPYGTDNSCTLNALKVIGSNRARGVGVIDSYFSLEQLREMHSLGVRGVRVNLESYGLKDPAIAAQILDYTQKLIAPLGWHIQIFTRPSVLVSLIDTIKSMSVPLVIDHFCLINPDLENDQEGLAVLLDLMTTGRIWLKLSAAYRISKQPGSEQVKALAKTLMSANADRVIWGSDWPHPGGTQSGHTRRVDITEPFQSINDGQALNLLATWTNDTSMLEKILVSNPSNLYDF